MGSGLLRQRREPSRCQLCVVQARRGEERGARGGTSVVQGMPCAALRYAACAM
jgi:hypothetical protein